MSRCKSSILVYGDSGDGKTALIGEMAEHVFRTQGKRTRLYCADPGGWQTIEPYVSLGIIEAIDLIGKPNPWEWLNAITQGALPIGPAGKWLIDDARNAQIGCFAFEGFTGIADILMQDLSRKAGTGNNIGGQAPAVKFKEGEAAITGNSPAHYGTVQTQITMACQQSFRLADSLVIWTAMARRASDADTNAPILGPQIVGKALTSEVPRWFVYTFRVMAIPADPLTQTKGCHRLFFEDHSDLTTPGAKGLGNSRVPLDADPFPSPYIEPASLVQALATIESMGRGAEAKIRERLAGLTLPLVNDDNR